MWRWYHLNRVFERIFRRWKSLTARYSLRLWEQKEIIRIQIDCSPDESLIRYFDRSHIYCHVKNDSSWSSPVCLSYFCKNDKWFYDSLKPGLRHDQSFRKNKTVTIYFKLLRVRAIFNLTHSDDPYGRLLFTFGLMRINWRYNLKNVFLNTTIVFLSNSWHQSTLPLF